jgi:hypothetical protein
LREIGYTPRVDDLVPIGQKKEPLQFQQHFEMEELSLAEKLLMALLFGINKVLRFFG